MPLVNVIRGERIEPAPFNVRTPYLKVPLWLVLVGWTVKYCFRLGVLLVKHWPVTTPALLLGWLYLRFDWYGPVVLVGALAVVGGAWFLAHRPSFERFAGYPVLGRWRRWTYRRHWLPAMATSGLAVTFDGRAVIPVLKRVRCNDAADVLTIRMVTGQIPDDFAKVSERLAHTFGARACRVAAGARPDLVTVTLLRTDPLVATVEPFLVADVPDFTALPLGRREDGKVYALRLFGTQVLVVGATDAGKGSVIWSLLRAMAAGIASGLVQVWAFDPKGGMELAAGRPLFARFACDDFEAMADMLEEAVATMRERTARLRGKTRQHVPTIGDPLIVIVIDELAALTAYLTNRQLKDRVKAALGVLLTQGRAVGVHVIACLQDPRKEVLPFRDLFPTRIGLRLTEEAHVDLTLGEGARDRGALCDRIPRSSPGVAYVVLDGGPTPMRVRFSYLTDNDVTDLAQTYGRLRPVATGGEAA
ncbi:cell division protein FtsK [Dactylosporangium roseum]|uniref:Cell division protein FtsK n=1 Tax=Dactylosporangium roseum TaxID=47989 RepID=A0ABY5ZF19_9ACTN|nr:cell division protein FtsK [Dactylosporangium roseum]